MKTRFILFAVASLVFFGCIKETDPSVSRERKITIRAYHEGGDLTRTTVLDGGTQVFWEPNDQILVFFKERRILFSSSNTENVLVSEFTGSLPELEEAGTEDMVWGLYPPKENATYDGTSITTYLPPDQIGRAGSFAKNTHITLAQSSDLNLAFYNVCGGLRFSLAQEGIKKVVFEGNNGEAIAGKIKISFEGGIPVVQEVIESKTRIQLIAPNGEPFQVGQWYYIEAIPGTLNDGFKLTLYKDSEFIEYSSSHLVTIKRSVYGSLGDVDRDLEFNSLTPQEYPVPEAIDLGLNVKWASFNLGASKPEDIGFYFAWGETEPKEYYDWSTYKWCNGDVYQLTRYNIHSTYGTVDDRKNLEIEDDAAHVKLGGNWLLPTKEDIEELNKYYGFKRDTLNGVPGVKLISIKEGYNDASFFLPATGYFIDDSLFSQGAWYYWCSSQMGGTGALAGFSFRADCFSLNNIVGFNRYRGQPIRPVYITTPATDIQISANSLTLLEGVSKTLFATILPSNASRKKTIWRSSDRSIASVDIDGVVKAVAKGTAVITATANDGSGISATCTVTVVSEPPIPEAVDLGLSVKWASFNLGASLPEDDGLFIAWGETDYKKTYSWSTYKWCNAIDTTLTKYNTSPQLGQVDNKVILDMEDDAAHVKLGGTWRIPTEEEMSELLNNCQWSKYSSNGRLYYVITSRKEGFTDKSILLPVCNSIPDDNYSFQNAAGFYWTSSLFSPQGYDADLYSVCLGFYDYSSRRISQLSRYHGLPIRPVCDK